MSLTLPWEHALVRLERGDHAERWRADPVAWVRERLGEDVSSKQAEVMRAVASNPLGYQPWRALLYLTAILAASAILAVVLGAHGLPTPRTAPRSPLQHQQLPRPARLVERAAGPQPCALIEQIGKGIDLGTPFLLRAATTRCEPTTTVTGAALVVSTWALQVVEWALAALFVAGFTGIVRKT